jgi:hypothetical protein
MAHRGRPPSAGCSSKTSARRWMPTVTPGSTGQFLPTTSTRIPGSSSRGSGFASPDIRPCRGQPRPSARAAAGLFDVDVRSRRGCGVHDRSRVWHRVTGDGTLVCVMITDAVQTKSWGRLPAGHGRGRGSRFGRRAARPRRSGGRSCHRSRPGWASGRRGLAAVRAALVTAGSLFLRKGASMRHATAGVAPTGCGGDHSRCPRRQRPRQKRSEAFPADSPNVRNCRTGEVVQVAVGPRIPGYVTSLDHA